MGPEIKSKYKRLSMSEEKYNTIYKTVIGNTEKILIENALDRTNGNQIVAARFLGLNRNTIRTKIKKLNINLDKYKHHDHPALSS